MGPSKPLKSFYSCIDTRLIKELTQPLQYVVIGHYAEQLGGRIAFYMMEDVYSCDSHEVVRTKVLSKPRVDGFIFFRFAQFYNNGRINLEVINFILDHGYELHFARERFSLKARADIDRLFPVAFTAHYLEERDRGHEFSLLAGRQPS